MTYSVSDFYDDVVNAAISRGLLLLEERDGLSDAATGITALIHELADRKATEGREPPRPVYEFEAVRYYGVGEPYSNGAGLQFTTKDRDEAYNALARFAERTEKYACEVRLIPGDGREARVLALSGPPMTVAKATSARAWNERRATLSLRREARAAGGFATPSEGREP